MGREIRRVPPNWQHPQEDKWDPMTGSHKPAYQPMFDEPYLPAITEWIEKHQAWERGEDPDRAKAKSRFYAQWDGGPPDVEFYRPDWKKEEMTWYQVYETVSEGTPVTPPFETQEELVDYLVENGDFWDQQRRASGRTSMNCDPWPREQAEAFVYSPGWAPSFVASDGKIKQGREVVAEIQE